MTSEAQILNNIETGHEEVINDAILDYYGTTLATASNDCKIKLFDVRNEQQRKIAELSDHTGSIWQLAWAHPVFGQILASCSYDGECIIYKKNETTEEWEHTYKQKFAKSLNSVCFAPPEFGLRLAVASQGEDIIILTHDKEKDTWEKKVIDGAHSMGVKAVSWAPGNMPSSLFAKNASSSSNSVKSPMRLVSGGDEKTIKIWKFDENSDKWERDDDLMGHEDWVRDVAWAPNIGLPEEQIASCSTDKKVIVWSRNLNQQEGDEQYKWKSHCLGKFPETISHVSWSLTGGVLACSGGTSHVSLWKQDLSGGWVQLDDLSQDGEEISASARADHNEPKAVLT